VDGEERAVVNSWHPVRPNRERSHAGTSTLKCNQSVRPALAGATG
jgi:hypothetical protein